MTAPADVRRFDFQDARRLAPGVSRLLSRWQGEICTLTTEAWGAIAAHPIQVSVGSIEPLRCTVAVGHFPDPGVGVLLQLGSGKLPTLLALEPVLLHALFADLLGASELETDVHRELTPLEESLWDLLLSKVRESIADAWPGPDPLPCAIKESCRPRRSRRLAHCADVILVRWRVACRFHTGEMLWAIPRRELETMLGELEPLGAVGEEEQPTDLRDVVEQFPLEVSVELGRASVAAGALSQLQVGDVLILDQPLNRPLLAKVGGEPLWLVEPRRVGPRQAVAIHSILDD
jgi:flagellar motor switch protein FliM